MCTTCGCDKGEARIEGAHQHTHVHADGTVHTHSHDHSDQHAHSDHHHRHDHSHGHRHADGTVHSHTHDHHHEHDHRDDLQYGAGPAAASAPGISQARMVQIEQDILSKNDELAAVNRKRLAERGIFAVNLVSSPGSGKTTLLVKTIEALKGKHEVVVIEGDQETSYDADRIRSTGARALQINTGKGCHLDADMVGQAVQQLAPPAGCVLMIENVGNLVCPAGFDLGEAHRVVVLSVTEGEDKPLKYPEMFRRSTLMLLNKIDLLQYVDFDIAKCVEYARRVNPNIRVIELSATKGHGMADWLAWISDGVADARRARQDSIGTLQARVAELEDEILALRSTLR